MDFVSEERKSEFKKGLGSSAAASAKRIDAHLSIRKDKRRDMRERMRIFKDRQDHGQFVQQLQVYNQGRSNGFDAFHRTIMAANDQQMNEHLPKLIKEENVLVNLISILRQGGNALAASECLAKIMESELLDKLGIQCAGNLIEGNILTCALPYLLSSKEEEKNVKYYLWKTLIGIIRTCNEARNAITADKRFQNAFSLTWPNPYFKPVLVELVKAALMINWMGFMGDCEDAVQMLPPSVFIQGTWPLMVDYLMKELMPAPRKQYKNDGDVIFNGQVRDVISFFSTVMQECRTPHMMNVIQNLVTESHSKCGFLKFFMNLVFRLEDERNKALIIGFFMHLSAFYITDLNLYRYLIEETECLKVMFHSLQYNVTDLVRTALIWIGNFASEGVPIVRRLVEAKILEEIMNRMHASAFSFASFSQAFYVLDTIAISCVEALQLQNEDFALADSILGLIFLQYNVMSITCRVVDRALHDPRLTLDILGLWKKLLWWKPREVKPRLEEYGGFDVLEKFRNQPNEAIYEAANLILEMYGPSADDGFMELDLQEEGNTQEWNF